MIVGASMHTAECSYYHAYMTMQVTVAIDAAKHCSFVYLSKTVGVSYVHRNLVIYNEHVHNFKTCHHQLR